VSQVIYCQGKALTLTLDEAATLPYKRQVDVVVLDDVLKGWPPWIPSSRKSWSYAFSGALDRRYLLIPMKVVSDSDLIPVTHSEGMPVTVGAKRRWRSYRA